MQIINGERFALDLNFDKGATTRVSQALRQTAKSHAFHPSSRIFIGDKACSSEGKTKDRIGGLLPDTMDIEQLTPQVIRLAPGQLAQATTLQYPFSQGQQASSFD